MFAYMQQHVISNDACMRGALKFCPKTHAYNSLECNNSVSIIEVHMLRKPSLHAVSHCKNKMLKEPPRQ